VEMSSQDSYRDTMSIQTSFYARSSCPSIVRIGEAMKRMAALDASHSGTCLLRTYLCNDGPEIGVPRQKGTALYDPTQYLPSRGKFLRVVSLVLRLNTTAFVEALRLGSTRLWSKRSCALADLIATPSHMTLVARPEVCSFTITCTTSDKSGIVLGT
jgi:hypothetical protein